MNRRLSPLWLVAAGVVLAALPAAASRSNARQQNAGVTLVSFGESQGELVTCGCHASPKGGLARRAAIIDSLEFAGMPYLHLELGDFAKLDAVTGDFETRFIWSILEKSKVAAVSPGPRELTVWPTFKDLRDKGTIPVIASNLTVADHGPSAPAGEIYRIFNVDGLRVAVFSLIAASGLVDARPPAGVIFHADDPLQTAANLVPKLRAKADLVVLMSQLPSVDTDHLIASVPGIDVALYGQRPSWQPMAQQKGATLCNETGARGQYVGRLALIVDPAGKVIDYGSENIALDNKVAEDTDIAQLVTDTQKSVADMEAAAAKKATTASDVPAANPPATDPAAAGAK